MNAKFRNLAPNTFAALKCVLKNFAPWPSLLLRWVQLPWHCFSQRLVHPLRHRCFRCPVSTSPSNGDLNPYGVLFVSGKLGGKLRPGDILVSNFNDKTNTMFLGTTIVDIRNGKQTATHFYTSTTAAQDLASPWAAQEFHHYRQRSD